MVFCSECGAANEVGSGYCYECGAVLEVTQPVKQKKKISAKPFLIGGGAVLAVLLVVGLVFLLLSGGSRDLSSAFDRTMEAFRGGNDRTTADRFASEMDKLLQNGDYTMILRSDSDDSIYLSMDYSRDNQIMDGIIRLQGVDVAWSIDDESIQFSVPGKFDNVYGLPLEQMDWFLEEPVISAILGDMKSVLDTNADFFKITDLESFIRNLAGKEYDALRKSVEIQELDPRDLKGQLCQVYEITWSNEAMNGFLAAVTGMGMLEEVAALELPDLGSECRCYVNREGYIAGLEFTWTGAQCLFTLEGRENPWDAFTLTVRSIYSETFVYTGGMTRTGSRVRFCLEDQAGILLELDYEDQTGEFALRTRDHEQALSGRFKVGDGLGLVLDMDVAGEIHQLSFSMEASELKPAPLTQKYIDLPTMDLVDWTRLLLDLRTLLE